MNGNMTRKTVKASGLTWRYSYDVADQLVRATRHDNADPAAPATQETGYGYDGLGRRVVANDTNYHYDGEHIVMEWRDAPGFGSTGHSAGSPLPSAASRRSQTCR